VLNVATIVTPPEDIADRMGLNLGLILTFAAFKITVAGDTPRVGYLTVLDKCVACPKSFSNNSSSGRVADLIGATYFRRDVSIAPRLGTRFLMIGFGLTAVLGVEAIIVYMLISTDTKLDGVGGGTPHGLARAVDNAVGMLYVGVVSFCRASDEPSNGRQQPRPKVRSRSHQRERPLYAGSPR
jgi:hypothetical protein